MNANTDSNENEEETEPEYVDEVFENLEDLDDPWSPPETPGEPTPAVKDTSTTPAWTPKPGPETRPALLENNSPVSKSVPHAVRTSAAANTAKPVLSDSPPTQTDTPEKPPRHLQRPFPHGTEGDREIKKAQPPIPVRRKNLPSTSVLLPGINKRIPDDAPTPVPTLPAVSTAKETPAKPIKAAIPEWVVLEKVLEKYPDLPQGSIVLGVDEAGKPLVLSLDDASTGALLVIGDGAADNRKHLRAILASGEQINQPELLQIDVVTPEKERFLSTSSNLRRICELSDPCVFDRLGEYLEEIEKRIRTERQLPFQILVLDEVDDLVERLSEDSLRFLRWMMRRGPQVGIWVFASIDSTRLTGFDVKTFRAFDLLLCGKITEPKTARQYTGISPKILKKLTRGAEGCFKIGENVVHYSIPEFAG